MLNRSKTWASVALVATFVSGIVVGGAAAAAWADYRKPTAVHQTFAQFLQSRLTLSGAQRDSVDAIVKSYRPRLDSAWQAFQPARDAYHASRDSILGEVRGRIASQLSAEQRVKYTELNAHADSARRARETQNNRGHDSAASHAK